MGKYSSDSDYEKSSVRRSHSRKHRDRSSSSDSSRSRGKRRKDKKSKRRSKSVERYRHSSSERRHKSYKSKSKRHSRERSYKRSPSSRSRSSSRDKYYSKSYKSKERSYSISSSSTLSSSEEEGRKDSRHKKKTAGCSKEETKEVKIKDELKTEAKHDSKILDEINSDSFAPKQFTSNSKSGSNKKVLDNIVIDLKAQTIKVPDVEITEPDSIFHHNLFMNEEFRTEKWVKELYSIRQKALQGDTLNK